MSGKWKEFTEKCENRDVTPETIYFCVEFLKENFMRVIRELEMAWLKIRKIRIMIFSGN